MATKCFCDVCQKEIPPEEVIRVWGRPEIIDLDLKLFLLEEKLETRRKTN